MKIKNLTSKRFRIFDLLIESNGEINVLSTHKKIDLIKEIVSKYDGQLEIVSNKGRPASKDKEESEEVSKKSSNNKINSED